MLLYIYFEYGIRNVFFTFYVIPAVERHVLLHVSTIIVVISYLRHDPTKDHTWHLYLEKLRPTKNLKNRTHHTYKRRKKDKYTTLSTVLSTIEDSSTVQFWIRSINQFSYLTTYVLRIPRYKLGYLWSIW